LLAIRSVVATVAEAHQLRFVIGPTGRDRGQVVRQLAEGEVEGLHRGHEQILPQAIPLGRQRVQRPGQAIVVALRRLDPPQVRQRRACQPGLHVHQRLRRQQAVDYQDAGDQPHVEVALQGARRVAAPVHHVPQMQPFQERQQQGQRSQVQDHFPVQRRFGGRGLPAAGGALHGQAKGPDRIGRVWHRDDPFPRAFSLGVTAPPPSARARCHTSHHRAKS
jgi:hypothetical protein